MGFPEAMAGIELIVSKADGNNSFPTPESRVALLRTPGFWHSLVQGGTPILVLKGVAPLCLCLAFPV